MEDTNLYVSLAQAWKRFCELHPADETSVEWLKKKFKAEVAQRLQKHTFEKIDFTNVQPISFRTWDDYFGSSYPRIYLLSYPDDVPLGDFLSHNSDFCEYVRCVGWYFKFPFNIVFERKALESLPVWNLTPDKHTRPTGPDANELIEIAKAIYAEGERDGKRAWKKAEANGIICTREKFLEAWAHTPNAGKPGPKGARRKKPERAG